MQGGEWATIILALLAIVFIVIGGFFMYIYSKLSWWEILILVIAITLIALAVIINVATNARWIDSIRKSTQWQEFKKAAASMKAQWAGSGQVVPPMGA